MAQEMMVAQPITTTSGEAGAVVIEAAGPRTERDAERVGRERVTEVTSSADDEFDEFCRREYAAVAGLAFVLTGDWGAAEDLTQDAFFAAYRRWADLRGYDKPGAWVRRVVANRAVSRRRRVASEARALARWDGRRTAPSSYGEIPALDLEIADVIRHLPPRQAQVFALAYVDDRSIADVAAILRMNENTAKTHLRRARATLAGRADLFAEDRDEPSHATTSATRPDRSGTP